MKYNFSNLTLLYVEDDEVIREHAVYYLTSIFFSVLGAKDGIEALRLYREFNPDIIIADIKMPRLNGLEFVKKVREKDTKTPIIITTAFTDNDILLKAVDLHLTKYLIKPINPDKLHKALNIAYEQIYLDTQQKIQITPEIEYDIKNMQITKAGKAVKLTKHELMLLELLVKNHQRVVTYTEIENRIWLESSMSIDSLRSLVRFLRKKLTHIDIENISGVGYRIKI